MIWGKKPYGWEKFGNAVKLFESVFHCHGTSLIRLCVLSMLAETLPCGKEGIASRTGVYQF